MAVQLAVETPHVDSQNKESITGRGAWPSVMYRRMVLGARSRCLAIVAGGWPMLSTMLCKCGKLAGRGA